MDIEDFIQAVKEVGNCEGLCRNLNVNIGKINEIKSENYAPYRGCLQVYYYNDKAKWENVVRAVTKYPIFII